MNKTLRTAGLLTVLFSSALILTACGDKEPEKTPAQIQFEQNVASSPSRSEEIMALITQSRGTPVVDTLGNPVVDKEGNPTGQMEGTLSKGMEREVTLSAMTKEQLLELEITDHIDIYLNGVLRDEFHVAANVLYGEDVVNAQKQAFKEALLSPSGDERGGSIADLIALKSTMRDPNVAKQHVDTVIQHLNRFYIQPTIAEDFGKRIVITGETYPIQLINGLNSIAGNATEFVELESDSDYKRTENDMKNLNKYYGESFVSALESAEIFTSPYKETLGGFEQKEDGLWYPSDMNRLAQTLITLAYIR